MSEKPILFNTAMVRAIIAGKKTQTRRICKGQPQDGITSPEKSGYKPPYQAGDLLYVREAWAGIKLGPKGKETTTYWYRADEDDDRLNPDDRWRPSIHMPKEAARIWLKVTNVRCERLQEITHEDVIAEGIQATLLEAGHPDNPYKNSECIRYYFDRLWDSTIKKTDLYYSGWDANPWVWVIHFERIRERSNT